MQHPTMLRLFLRGFTALTARLVTVTLTDLQGKLQLWVDIFPTSEGKVPEAVNIKPREPQE